MPKRSLLLWFSFILIIILFELESARKVSITHQSKGNGSSKRWFPRLPRLQIASVYDDEIDPVELIDMMEGYIGYNDSFNHPLRKKSWVIFMKKGLFDQREETKYAFRSDGEFRTQDGDKGAWEFVPRGIMWKLEKDNTTYHFSAEVNYNLFGEQPRMLRGVVVRDRRRPPEGQWGVSLPPWLLRPCVGTFRGEGVGSDTLNSYCSSRVSAARYGGGGSGGDSY